MQDWIPFLQTATRPLLIGAVLLLNKKLVGRLVTALITRVEQGAPIKAAGLEIGSAPLLPLVSKETKDPRQIDDLPHEYYLVHTARRDRNLDKRDKEYYRLRIVLDADKPKQLDDVASVTYRLHPTFDVPVRVMSERSACFELRTACWGKFNMTAEISFRDGRRSLNVERYINLPG